MTTIGQLPPATSVSDSDEIAIFQNSQTLSATRAQFLAGVQAALSLPQNTLLGGAGPGTTTPVPITIGANLALSGTTLSATAAPFSIAGLPTGSVPVSADLVALSHGGANEAVSYANFMAGIANVPGLPVGGLSATAAGGTVARTLAAIGGNAVSIEDFGAVGDGVTDDSAALLSAMASGQPVRLGPKTYAIAGECDITGTSVSLIGVAGLSVLKRSGQTKLGTAATPSWINITCTNFYASGVIFDANAAVTAASLGVVVQPACTKTRITDCVFKGAVDPANGNGLTYLPNDPAVTEHHIEGCEFASNAVNGLLSFAMDGMSVINCQAHDNGANGICGNSTDPTFVLKVRAMHILGNSCWNNGVGILVGNFVANNVFVQPFLYGNANPDVLAAVIASNNCFSNKIYGIFISGRNILVSGNLCTNNSSASTFGAGILCDTGYCKITGNMITGATPFGIDCGGSIYTEVDSNYINGAHVGLNIGGGQYCTGRSNFVQDCTSIAISVQNVESNGAGDTFGLPCQGLSLVGNFINYSGYVVGILVRDGAQNVRIEDNVIVGTPGASLTNAMSLYTDALILRRNVLNYTTRWAVNPATVNGLYTLTVPDIADAVSVSQATSPIASIITAQGALTQGQVTFCKMTSGGTGYTSATVSIAGTGSGAAGTALIYQGVVVGIQMSSFGSGYGSGTTVTIAGNGSGAAATAQVGLPAWQGKELTVDCLAAVTFAESGASPAQSNWTGAPITVPAGASIDWVGLGNSGWRAARFTQSDYVSPNGDGSVTLKTQSGDISLHPSGTGMVRLISDTESTGAVELIGRGSPLSVVSAPAGSTFRNLNGGVGSTFWVKQSGTGSANWVAVA